ncbi:hypothetical protein KM92DES2_11417 [uncultured Desulfovibrio sp.]|uniref:Uncharacterized protein n=1 Tax=uncultured Desulfovibrio sp. TaxID=167968 RepID=A0A212JN66_9BACT|nr:hypothetical protein KM92DES2_11417 [uncultured Desulfovibrio sp.]
MDSQKGGLPRRSALSIATQASLSPLGSSLCNEYTKWCIDRLAF